MSSLQLLIVSAYLMFILVFPSYFHQYIAIGDAFLIDKQVECFFTGCVAP